MIEGYNLNLAADESDLEVRIGTERCNVTSLTSTQGYIFVTRLSKGENYKKEEERIIFIPGKKKFKKNC